MEGDEVSDDAAREIARVFEARAAIAVEERGPAALRSRGGKARLLKTDTGKIVTHGEVLAGLLARAEIEVAVADGKRPEWVSCETCRVPVHVHHNGRIPSKCDVHSGKVCSECGKVRPSAKGEPGMCRACARSTGKLKHGRDRIGHERRSANAKKMWARRSAKQRAALANKFSAGMTAEQRSEKSKRQAAAKTPEERSAMTRKSWETRKAKVA